MSFKAIYGTLENFKAAIAEQAADEARAADQAYLASLPWWTRENILENRNADAYAEQQHNEWCENGEALRFHPELPWHKTQSYSGVDTDVIVTYLYPDGTVSYIRDLEYGRAPEHKTIVTPYARPYNHPRQWSPSCPGDDEIPF